MPFRAKVDGKKTLGFNYAAAAWKALVVRVHGGEDAIRMLCCDAPGTPKTSKLGNHFFAHRAKPPETCHWEPESPEHHDLKAAVRDAVNAMDGWSAEIEVFGPDWKADVLASRRNIRVAFEVQLSIQGQAETAFREARYANASVLPWWLVSARNSGDGFGSALRTRLEGEDIDARRKSAIKAARDVLNRLERQVRMTNAVSKHLRSKGVAFKLQSKFGIPSVFYIEVAAGQLKPIVIGELGEGVVPDFDFLREHADDAVWGSVVQFVSGGQKQIKGFKSTALYIKDDPAKDIPSRLNTLLAGELVWHPRDGHVKIEASIVWYPEQCKNCGKLFARAPFTVAGRLHRWPGYEPCLIRFPPIGNKEWARAVLDRFEQRTKLLVGEVWGWPHEPAKANMQNCPHCQEHYQHSLVTVEQALQSWPLNAVDFLVQHRVKDSGTWRPPRPLEKRVLPPVRAWDDLLNQVRQRLAEEEAEEQRRKTERAARDAERKERERLKHEAAKAEAERQRQAELAEAERFRQWEAEWQKTEALAREEETRDKLQRLARAKFRNDDLAEVWLRATDRRIGGRPIDICVSNFEACRELLATARVR